MRYPSQGTATLSSKACRNAQSCSSSPYASTVISSISASRTAGFNAAALCARSVFFIPRLSRTARPIVSWPVPKRTAAGCVSRRRPGLEAVHKAGLAIVGCAHPAHGLFPFGSAACPPIAVSGPLKIREHGVVVFALFGIDDAQPLGAPEPGGKAWMDSLQCLRCRLGGAVAHAFQSVVTGTPHQFRETLHRFGLDE